MADRRPVLAADHRGNTGARGECAFAGPIGPSILHLRWGWLIRAD